MDSFSLSIALLLGRYLSEGSLRLHVCPRCKHIFYHYQILALLSCGMVPKNLQPKSSDKKTPYGNNRKRNTNIKSIMWIKQNLYAKISYFFCSSSSFSFNAFILASRAWIYYNINKWQMSSRFAFLSDSILLNLFIFH